MQLKHGDKVYSKDYGNNVEALVDLIIGDKVYITPWGKLSFDYPERYIVSKNILMVKQDDGKYHLTKLEIEKDYYITTGSHIWLDNFRKLEDTKKGDEVIIDGSTYKFKECFEGHYMFTKNCVTYELTQKDLDDTYGNLESIVNEIYGLTIKDIIIEDDVKDTETKQAIKEVPLIEDVIN